jgi:hypothetical protein
MGCGSGEVEVGFLSSRVATTETPTGVQASIRDVAHSKSETAG